MNRIYTPLQYIVTLMVLLTSGSANALEVDYIQAKKLFWERLYNTEFTTLYCAQKQTYNGDEKNSAVTVEQVYPDAWVAEELGCRYKNDCRHPIFKGASSDLHNMWPVLRKYARVRGKRFFTEIEGNTPFYKDGCAFEADQDRAEPADASKGEIARSLLYMINQYHLSPRGMLPTLVEWHHRDPVSAEERRRNKIIFEVQGRYNPFIEVLEKPSASKKSDKQDKKQ